MKKYMPSFKKLDEVYVNYKKKVLLPADQLIDYYFFCKAIAESIFPADEKELTGIDCIVGKQIMVRASFNSETSVDQTEMAELSNEPLPERGHEKIEEFPLPYDLSDNDRRLLEKLLPKLPALHFPLSEQTVAEFMNAYIALPNRPAWVPLFITDSIIEQRRTKQHEARKKHQANLVTDLKLGRLTVVNADNIPETNLAPGVFIPKRAAIAYLDRHGISYTDATTADTDTAEISKNGQKKKRIGVRTLTDEQERELVKYRNDLFDKDLRDFNQKTADKFNLTTRQVYNIVKKFKENDEIVKAAQSFKR